MPSHTKKKRASVMAAKNAKAKPQAASKFGFQTKKLKRKSKRGKIAV